jgi:oligopeptide transport system ATP-binding protein
MKQEVLLDVKNLKKYFSVGQNQTLKAVDDVTLQIYKGETLGLVGESGCGKSTFGRTVIHLYEPTEGELLFDGIHVDHILSRKEAHNLTQRMQMIFQDPYASLNPRRKILDIVAEGIDSHHLAKKPQRTK